MEPRMRSTELFRSAQKRRCINCDVMDLIRIAGTGIDVARHRMVRAEAAAIHGNPCCSIFLEKQVYCVNVPLSFFINSRIREASRAAEAVDSRQCSAILLDCPLRGVLNGRCRAPGPGHCPPAVAAVARADSGHHRNDYAPGRIALHRTRRPRSNVDRRRHFHLTPRVNGTQALCCSFDAPSCTSDYIRHQVGIVVWADTVRCQVAGAPVSMVSLDGTKLAGNAAQKANKTLPQIEKILAEAAERERPKTPGKAIAHSATPRALAGHHGQRPRPHPHERGRAVQGRAVTQGARPPKPSGPGHGAHRADACSVMRQAPATARKM